MIHSRPGRYLVFGLLLAAAALFAAGCGGAKENKEEAPAAAGAAGSGAALAVLPADGAAEGWTRSGEPRVFNADSLWVYIDGGAEGYLIYNFQEVATADYQGPDGLQAVVDVYRMANELCGFGIYSSERPYEAQYNQIGCQGYFTRNALNFWQGPYYVKVTSFKEGNEVEPALRKLAEAARAAIPAKAEIPPELDVFPADNLIPNTVRYLARDVLGQSDLKNGFTAEYKDGDTEYKLFFILHETVEEAQKSYESYKTFMTKYAKDLEDHSDEEVPWFSAKDPYYEKVLVMQAGKTMLGALGLQDAERVNDYLGRMQQKLAALGRI
ncbi:hypothetical protein LLH00_18160 [bacterium]|nr:hypothetical protein [bacterium]